MATKNILRFAAIAALLLSAAACKYPYEVVIPEADYPLVIEGDILLGATTTFRFSYVLPMDSDPVPFSAWNSSGWIEGENGVRVEGWVSRTGNVLEFDTANLPANQRYKLHLHSPEGRIIESDWMDVCPAPTIDDLSYWKNEQYNELHIGLSMHCNGAHYFRWSYNEEWEYHSDIRSPYEYDPDRYEEGVIESPDGPKYYYCWDEQEASVINIFSTENQIEDRFEELSFHRIPLNNLRLQSLYRMTLHLEAISEEAYTYWRTVRQNSDEQGSLFAPTPSEVASNLRCTSDPSHQVLGYVNAANVATATMYYDNEVAHFYQPPYVNYLKRREQEVPVDRDSCLFAYKDGLLPFNPIYDMMGTDIVAYTWADRDCIDCRRLGGHKNKPADWPNDHK
ncbi:MAG: DUF4249 family protein [Bacteroidales bacterium]|nr:DUF4249 family protein [Bacteroidales bacterium]